MDVRTTLERASTRHDMIAIPGGTFHMGSDKHYPEEAPVHRVTLDGFWMDRTPVTNREFRKFVEATGYVTSPKSCPIRRIIRAHCHTCCRRVRSSSAHPTTPSTLAISRTGEFQVRCQLASTLWQGQFDPRSRRPSRARFPCAARGSADPISSEPEPPHPTRDLDDRTRRAHRGPRASRKTSGSAGRRNALLRAGVRATTVKSGVPRQSGAPVPDNCPRRQRHGTFLFFVVRSPSRSAFKPPEGNRGVCSGLKSQRRQP